MRDRVIIVILVLLLAMLVVGSYDDVLREVWLKFFMCYVWGGVRWSP